MWVDIKQPILLKDNIVVNCVEYMSFYHSNPVVYTHE